MVAVYARNKKALISKRMIFDLELKQAALRASAHRLTESLSIFDRVITANPLPLAYACRGHVFERDCRDYSKAISDYTQAIQIEEAGRRSEDSHRMQHYFAGACASEYYLYRSIGYMHNEELVKALADASTSIGLFEQWAAVDPKNSNYGNSQNAIAYARRAEILSRMGKLEPALVDFKIALTRRFLIYNADSELASIYLLRGAAYMRAGRINDALADYNNCVLKASGDPRPYISRAEAYERLGDHKQALADYERAQKCIEQYAPKHRPIKTMDNMPEWKERMAQSLYEGRARVYYALKEKKLADVDREKARAQKVSI